MDLTRLYNLTTPELREEAERLGVGDTYAMSRGQLIHAIRNRAAGQQQPEGFFGKVLGFAKWAIQAAQEEPRKESASPPARVEAHVEPLGPQEPARRFERPSEPMPSLGGAETASESVSESAPESVPESAPAPAPAPGSVAKNTIEGAIESAIESVIENVIETVTGIETGTGTGTGAENENESEIDEPQPASGPPSRPPAGVFSKSSGMFEEPFPTLTMARILAEQGHFKRALAIYATLVADEPGDRELSAEANDVRAQSRVRRSQVH